MYVGSQLPVLERKHQQSFGVPVLRRPTETSMDSLDSGNLRAEITQLREELRQAKLDLEKFDYTLHYTVRRAPLRTRRATARACRLSPYLVETPSTTTADRWIDF